MLNLAALQTVEAGKYDLGRVLSNGSKFLEFLLRNKQLMYDWGRHYFFACSVPFSVDYDKKVILDGDGKKIADENWVGGDPADLHQRLAHVFQGNWGPTAVDTILRLENSGISIALCGTSEFGPKDPKAFLEALKQKSDPGN